MTCSDSRSIVTREISAEKRTNSPKSESSLVPTFNTCPPENAASISYVSSTCLRCIYCLFCCSSTDRLPIGEVGIANVTVTDFSVISA